MAKSKDKSKAPKGNKRFEQGYVSFTPEDLRQQAMSDPANAEAYDLLDQAMTTSSHITVSKDDLQQGGTVDIDDVYPVSLEETNEMDRLLDEAERRAGNPNDPLFRERLDELRNIVHWSKKRHYNFSWMIILGVFIMVCALFYWSGDAKSSASKAKTQVERIKNWQEMDTTITLESQEATWKEYQADLTDKPLSNANYYKANKLKKYAKDYYYAAEYADSYTQHADTATSKDLIKFYKEQAKVYSKNAKEAKDQYNDLNDMKFKKVKKMALKEAKAEASEANSFANFVWFWNMLFLFLIPLYIYADRPFGYMETRYRTEAKVLGGIRKVAFGIAGFLAGGALAMEYLPDTIVKWSDGSTTREGNTGNFVIIVIKIAMYIAAIAILAVVSCFLMLYSTITGLYRNYDWTPLKNKMTELFGKAKDRIQTPAPKA